MNPTKLLHANVPGAGQQIHAVLDRPIDFPESAFNKKPGPHGILFATEPWVQFEPKEWTDMLTTVFGQMVEAWNEKHAEGPKKIFLVVNGERFDQMLEGYATNVVELKQIVENHLVARGELGYKIEVDLSAYMKITARKANASYHYFIREIGRVQPPSPPIDNERVTNFYRCTRCKHEWWDKRPCVCNALCPECNVMATPHTHEEKA